jgi:serine/threonine protein kinase
MGAGGLNLHGTYTANIGSPAYMAPEMLSYSDTKTHYIGGAVDMYSYGECACRTGADEGPPPDGI